jgi:hypothetical protein
MKKALLIIYCLLFASGICFAQDGTSYAVAIKKYQHTVDSLISKNAIVQSFADGFVKKKFYMNTLKNGKPIKTKVNGGSFSEHTAYNLPGRDSIYKIECFEYTDHTFDKVFYYKMNKIVSARLIIRDSTVVLFDKEEFYKDDNLVFQSTMEHLKPLNAKITPNSMLKDGNSYLESNLQFLKVK